jgi:hypothetical protein
MILGYHSNVCQVVASIPVWVTCGRFPWKAPKHSNIPARSCTIRIKKPSAPLRTSQGPWARNNIKKAHAFAEHLAKIFQPHPSENEPKETKLMQLLETLYHLKPAINCLKRAEVQEVINSLNPKKMIRLRPHHWQNS